MIANKYLHLKARQKKKVKNSIDKLCYFGSIFMPATAIPQIHQLYTTQNAGGLSLLMWVLYLIGVIPFLLFGVFHNEKQLVILNTLWIIAIVSMISGIIMYS